MTKEETLMRAGRVRRWHTNPGLEQSVAEHSWGVAVLMYLENPHISPQLLMAALLHDVHELSFGDMPSPIKQVHPAVVAAEDQEAFRFFADLGIIDPVATISKREKLALARADKKEALLFLKSEVSRPHIGECIDHILSTHPDLREAAP